MPLLRNIRFLTYCVIIAIAFVLPGSKRVLPVRFAQKNDYRGDLPPPGSGWLESSMSKDNPPVTVLPYGWGGSMQGFEDKLGHPAVKMVMTQPIDDVGTAQGVQANVAAMYPNYRGAVTTCIWERRGRWVQAFFVNVGGEQKTVDALSWETGATPQ